MQDSWRSLLKLRTTTKFALWNNLSFTFPKITSITIPDKLRNLKQIPMPSFIDYVHDYKEVNVIGRHMSFWTYVIIAFSTVIFLAFALFFYLKCSKHRKQNRFAQR